MILTPAQFSAFRKIVDAIFKGDVGYWQRAINLYQLAAGDEQVSTYIKSQVKEANEIILDSSKQSTPEKRKWAFYQLAVYQYLFEKNYKEAATLYEQAIYLGHLTAINNLAYLYHHGAPGIPQDLPRAIALYQRAVDLNHPGAMTNLAYLYHRGAPGIPQDLPRAIALYQRAVDLNYLPAMYNLAYLYDHGAPGIPPNLRRAIALYQQAVDLNDPAAMCNLACLYHQGAPGIIPQDLPRAIALYQQAVDLNIPLAMCNLARLYQHGVPDIIPKDLRRAIALYERAVDLNYPSAMNNLAYLYQHGVPDIIPKDLRRAIALYERAVDLNEPAAMNNLAYLYLYGVPNIISQNLPQARALYQRAVDLNESEAMTNYAVLYLKTRPAPSQSDLLSAIMLLERAITLNHLRAKEIRTGMYVDRLATGNDDVSKLLDLMWDRLIKNASLSKETRDSFQKDHPQLLVNKLLSQTNLKVLRTVLAEGHIIRSMLVAIGHGNDEHAFNPSALQQVQDHLQAVEKQRMMMIGLFGGVETRNRETKVPTPDSKRDETSPVVRSFVRSGIFDPRLAELIVSYCHDYPIKETRDSEETQDSEKTQDSKASDCEGPLFTTPALK
jgi:TPR repeat protein